MTNFLKSLNTSITTSLMSKNCLLKKVIIRKKRLYLPILEPPLHNRSKSIVFSDIAHFGTNRHFLPISCKSKVIIKNWETSASKAGMGVPTINM